MHGQTLIDKFESCVQLLQVQVQHQYPWVSVMDSRPNHTDHQYPWVSVMDSRPNHTDHHISLGFCDGPKSLGMHNIFSYILQCSLMLFLAIGPIMTEMGIKSTTVNIANSADTDDT